MTIMRHALCALGLIAFPQVAHGQVTDSAVPLRLLRCMPHVDMACLQTRVTLDAHGVEAARLVDSATETRSWAGSLSGYRLLGPAVRFSREITPPLRLLVLIDLSGSMKGTSIAYVRTAIRTDLLRNLDSTSARVAIAGFESHHVVDGIDSVTFLSPENAMTALTRLGDPVANGNTGLYSAIVAASARLRKELASVHGAQGAILLVTDGGNDVRGSGDANLLDGPSGLERATQAARGPGQAIWILGVGKNIAGDVLAQIAAKNFVAAEVTPVDIGRQLSSIVREFRGARELTFGVSGGDADALARAPWAGTATLAVNDSTAVRAGLAWRPPFFALPAFDGVVDSLVVPASLREAARDSASSRSTHWLIVGAFALLGILFGTLLPRLVWIRTLDGDDVAIAPPVAERPRVTAKAAPIVAPAAVAPGTGLRTDVVEVAPRRSGDVTAQSARWTPTK